MKNTNSFPRLALMNAKACYFLSDIIARAFTASMFLSTLIGFFVIIFLTDDVINESFFVNSSLLDHR